MRWHVHGTDVTTGQPVTLAVEETHATDAVQTALSKRIIVSHVTREWLRRSLFPFSCAAVVVLTPLCVGLYGYEQNLHHELRLAQDQEARLGASLTESEAMINDLKAAGAAHPDARALDAANARAEAAERQLTDARLQIAADRGLADRLEANTEALATLRRHSADLEAHVKEEMQRVADAAVTDSQARLDSLQSANKGLAAQVELLKSQLLVAAAKSAPAPESKSDDDSTPARSPLPTLTRWALRTGYDAASDFMALHFDKETMKTQARSDGTLLRSAISVGNASTLRILCDTEKRRVYSVTLTVSLAPDAPKATLDENLSLIAQTLKTFAPAMKDAESRIARVTAQLAGKDASERTEILSDDAKITVWNNHTGEYTWRIESLGNDAGG